MNLSYTMQGDYLIPNLTVPESPKIGKYGMLRKAFLREHQEGLYTGMLLSGNLNRHLEEIDQTANEMMDLMVTQMAMTAGVTESLKASNQMAWVQAMNNIRSAAEETILTELIYS